MYCLDGSLLHPVQPIQLGRRCPHPEDWAVLHNRLDTGFVGSKPGRNSQQVKCLAQGSKSLRCSDYNSSDMLAEFYLMVKRDAEYFDGGLLLDRSSIEDNGGYWPVPTMVGNSGAHSCVEKRRLDGGGARAPKCQLGQSAVSISSHFCSK